MSDRRAELIELTNQFVDAFNRQNLDDVVSFFAEDAVYEDSRGGSHTGPDAIRTAFEPLYLLLPQRRGWCRTGISVMRAPTEAAQAGMKRCISPYRRTSCRTSRR